MQETVARNSGGGGLAAAGLLALCLVVYLPGFFAIPPVDRDESRFAQASRQMFESVALPEAGRDARLHGGGLLVPMVQDRPRLNKPPLIYWLQAGSAAVFTRGDPLRDAIWMYRVPSLIAAIVAVMLTWRIGAGMFGERVGAISGAMLAVCPVFAWEAHQARADLVLVAWTIGAMGAMWGVWRGELHAEARRRGASGQAVLFWACVAGGVMTKGPITPMVAGLAAVGVSLATRRWVWLWKLRPGLGVLIVAAAVGPWVWGVMNQVGARDYLYRVADEVLGRSVSAKEGHWGPPGYHLVLLPVLFWPGSLLTGWGVVRAWKESLGRRRDREGASAAGAVGNASSRSRFRLRVDGEAGDPLLFCLAWAIPAWIAFELVGTKLPHYTMPLYPALAIVSAWAVVGSAGSIPRRQGLGTALWIAIGSVIVAGALALVSVTAPVVGMVAAGVVGAALVPMLWRAGVAATGGRYEAATRIGVWVAVVVWLVVGHWALPRIVILSAALSQQLAAADPGRERPVAAVGYHEDSLVFLTRGRVERIEQDTAEGWLESHPRGLLVYQRHAGRLPERWRSLAEVTGFNYSKGRVVECAIVERAP